jgi:hypothetical protein
MSVRKLTMVLAAVCAAALIAPVAAGAQTPTTTGVPTTSFTHVPVSGTVNNGKQFTGHFDVTQFVTRAGKTYALGTLTGNVGNRTVSKSDVAIPTSVQKTTGISPAATCPILHLVLGPLNLNLLGLKVHLNQVVLDINAQSGPGNLLGNLLCSVANLLNGTGATTPLSPAQLTGLLNIVQQLVNVPGLGQL